MYAQSLSWMQLFDLMVCSAPGSSVQEILQARVLDWVAISSSRGSSQPRDQTWVSCMSCVGKWIHYHRATWEALFPSDPSFLPCALLPHLCGHLQSIVCFSKPLRSGEVTVAKVLFWHPQCFFLPGGAGYPPSCGRAAGCLDRGCWLPWWVSL